MKPTTTIVTFIGCILITLLISYLLWGRNVHPNEKSSYADPAYAAEKGKAASAFLIAFLSDTATYYSGSQTGSGVLISPDGYMVTNEHVISGGTQIQVSLDNRHEFTAQVIGTDPTHDIALLKIPVSNASFLPFGNSDSLRIGETVLAVGSPYRLQSTVTSGIVSALNRDIKLPDNKTANFIQTDAAINFGNSGGALLNAQGELIGLNIAMLSSSGQYEGFTFAIPSNLVKKITEDLLQYGELQRASIGFAIREVDGEMAYQSGLKGIFGVVVETIKPDGAADRAGVKPLDIITSINGNLVTSSAFFRGSLDLYRPGDNISLGIVRNGKDEMIEVKLDTVAR